MLPALQIACAILLLAPDGSTDRSAVFLDEYAPCGTSSLYLVCRLRAVHADFQQVERLLGAPDADGWHSFADLTKAAQKLGLHPLGVHVDRAALGGLPTPSIVHSEDPVAGPHLSVLLACADEGAYILDAPYQARLVPWSLFNEYWTGNVLVFPSSDVERARLKSQLPNPHVLNVLFWILLFDVIALAFVVAWLALSTVRNPEATADAAAIGKSTEAIAGEPVDPDLSKAFHARAWRLWHRPRFSPWGALAGLCAAFAGAGVLTIIYFQYDVSQVVSFSPRLSFDKPVIDLGEFPPGDYERSIVLYNTGWNSLMISRVESSCSCAVVTKPESIARFSSTDMKVKFAVAPGRGHANFVLHSNDPGGPRDVTLRWFGSEKPMLLPRRIAGGISPLDKPYERTVEIAYPGGRSPIVPELRRAACETGNVHVEVLRNDPKAFRTASELSQFSTIGYLSLRVRVDAPQRPEHLNTSVALTVGYGKHEYELKLPVSVRFVGPLDAQPDCAVFAGLTPTDLENQSRTIRLVAHKDSGSLAVLKSPKWLRCELSPTNEDTSELHMVVVEPPPSGLSSDTLEIGSETDPDIRLPISVSAFVQAR
ncbi:MAG: DUF1573 domain-containing protein [Pirellulales bacterium]